MAYHGLAKDHRYSVRREGNGIILKDGKLPFVVRFCGAYLGWAEDRDKAWRMAEGHNKERTQED